MYQVLCIIVAIMAFINGIYLIYRFVTMPKRDLRFGEGQTLYRLNQLYNGLQSDYIMVFDVEDGEKFYHYGSLYYNPEGKDLVVVCDCDYSKFDAEGLVKLDLPLVGSQEVE